MDVNHSSHSDKSVCKNTTTRDERGRFIPSSPANDRKLQLAQHQREHRERRRSAKNKIFNRYLAAFVLKGKGKDCISASRSKGPFPEIFASVVKEEYRLGPNLRFAALRNFCSEGGHLSSDKRRSKVQMKPRQYKECRLPRVQYRSEMNTIKEWIIIVEGENALLFASTDQAFDFCKDSLRNWAARKAPVSCAIRPLLLNSSQNPQTFVTQQSSLPSETENPPNSSLGTLNTEVTTTAAETMKSTTPTRVPDLTATDLSQRAITWPEISKVVGSSRSDVMRNKRLEVCLEIARNPQMYTLVHLAQDDNLGSRFGSFAGVFLKELRKRGEETCELVEQTLTYAHWRCFCRPNEFEFNCLERRLKNTAAIIDRIRFLTSTAENPSPLYKDMRWDSMT